jgi:hypothetical protein
MQKKVQQQQHRRKSWDLTIIGNKINGAATKATCKVENAQAKQTPNENPESDANTSITTKVKYLPASSARPTMKYMTVISIL